MGQILNRAFRVAKSLINESDSHYNFDKSDSEELKKIIDELGRDRKQFYTNDNKKQRTDSSDFNLDDAYKILMISHNAGIDEIKTAFKNRIKEYHPDRLENFGDDIKELARRKTQDINRAYELIKNERGF